MAKEQKLRQPRKPRPCPLCLPTATRIAGMDAEREKLLAHAAGLEAANREHVKNIQQVSQAAQRASIGLTRLLAFIESNAKDMGDGTTAVSFTMKTHEDFDHTIGMAVVDFLNLEPGQGPGDG